MFMKINCLSALILATCLSGQSQVSSINAEGISSDSSRDEIAVYSYRSKSRIDSLNQVPVVGFHDGIVIVLQKGEGLEYSFFLEGPDTGWTGWTEFNYKEYTSLEGGRYELLYRIRSGGNDRIKNGSFFFRVGSPWYKSVTALIIYPVAVVIILLLFRIRTHRLFRERQNRLEQLISERTEELLREKEKSDKLLANMLPKGTAEEIISKGKAAKTKYNFVTVLFSDIQGFTRIAEEMNPEILIDELDRFFFHFDSVVEKYRIEKIKTIGDAYMCAGGIPERNRTNPVEVVLAALEMQQYMKVMRDNPENSAARFWDIRIGIHTGTVIAGVVGQKKITYDIWGDTVNTASRMESSGEAGKVNISGTTYEFVKEYFTFDYRGKMPVKYKGDLEMYFVTGIKPELSDDTGRPNRRFLTKLEMIRILDVEEHVFSSYTENASPDLFFHSIDYVRSVCLQADLLARAEKLDDQSYIQVRLASVFLYLGYVFDYDDALNISKKRADEILSYYGFDSETLASVKKLMDNAFSNIQTSQEGMVLHDAVYDFTGRVDFISRIDRLYREEMAYGKVEDKERWLRQMEVRLKETDFLTESARKLRSVTAASQMELLRSFSADMPA